MGAIGGLVGALLLLTLGAAGCGHAKAGREVHAQRIVGGQVPPGTVLVAQLDRSLGIGGAAVGIEAGKRGPGEASPGQSPLEPIETRVGTLVSARVASPLVDEAGKEIVPRGSELLGHVAALRPAGDGRPPSIVLAFDALRVGPIEHPLSVRVLAVDVGAATRGLRPEALKLGARPPSEPGAILPPDGPPEDEDQGGTAISLGAGPGPAGLPIDTALSVEVSRAIPVAALRAPRSAKLERNDARPAPRAPVETLPSSARPFPAQPGDPATPNQDSTPPASVLPND